MTGSLITAWDVYWVMQLDNILKMVGGLQIFLVVALVVIGFAALVAQIEMYNEEARAAFHKKTVLLGKVTGFGLGFMSLLSGLLPSSKTAAAMIILPALTSEEVVEPLSREAGEIYKLAKIGLTNLVTEDAAKVIEEETDNEDAE